MKLSADKRILFEAEESDIDQDGNFVMQRVLKRLEPQPFFTCQGMTD